MKKVHADLSSLSMLESLQQYLERKTKRLVSGALGRLDVVECLEQTGTLVPLGERVIAGNLHMFLSSASTRLAIKQSGKEKGRSSERMICGRTRDGRRQGSSNRTYRLEQVVASPARQGNLGDLFGVVTDLLEVTIHLQGCGNTSRSVVVWMHTQKHVWHHHTPRGAETRAEKVISIHTSLAISS
jgi:hypothetical protein